VATVEGDGYVEIHDQVRETLGLDRRPVRPVPSGSGDSASPLERHWRRLQAMRGVEVPKGPITIDDLGDVEAIPVPAGPFGGTTVVVVPRDAAPDARSVWKNLESSGAMEEAHGRFHHLAVAFEDEAPRLDEVLDDLEGRGRRNVLIVPAVFYAGSQTMRELRDQAAAHADRMTISWLPGLGGSLPVQ
jgi:hypothetical protein